MHNTVQPVAYAENNQKERNCPMKKSDIFRKAYDLYDRGSFTNSASAVLDVLEEIMAEKPENMNELMVEGYVLAASLLGRLFIRTYYAVSPALVKWFGDTRWFKKLWRGHLDRMVSRLNAQGVADTPYEDKNW